MKPSSSQRCPDCWTTFDGQPPACPACGTRLRSRKRSRWALLALLPAVVAGMLVLRGSGETTRPGPGDSDAAPSDAPREPPAAGPRPETRTAAPPAVWHLGSASDRDAPVTGLLLRAPAGARPDAYLLLPLEGFPLHGDPVAPDGSEPGLSVVTWSDSQGFVLLAVADAAGIPVDAALARGTATLAAGEALSLGGGPATVRIVGQRNSRRVLDREAPPGVAILDSDGRAVGLTAGGDLALPVDPALPWLGQPGTGELAGLRVALRAGNPALVIEDATRLLAELPSAARTRRALALLDAALGTSRDRGTLLELEELRQDAAHVLVRQLGRADPAEGLAEARQQVARHPTHAGLLSDLLVLALRAGDPREVLGLWDRLSGLSADHAQEVAEVTASTIAGIARDRARERRYQEALDLTAELAVRFSHRADLQMLHARTLWESGRREEAVAAGLVAARLDPSHADEVTRWNTAVVRDRDPQTVALPYDPATNVISTWVTIGGQRLELLIDTGASLTTIPSGFARRLGILTPDSPTIEVETANGRVTGRRVRIPDLTIGSIRLRSVEVVVLDLPGNLDGKGLLGLNVLQPLNMRIDSDSGLLILQQPRGRRRR